LAGRGSEMPRGAGDWSREEEEAIVADYFSMLAAELCGEAYNKTHHRHALQKMLSTRNDASIERKHQNISAVLLALGYPYIDGYKPLQNMKASLRSVVLDRLSGAHDIRNAVEKLVEAPVAKPGIRNILDILAPAPIPGRKGDHLRDGDSEVVMQADYVERDQRNRALGRAGEEVVMEFEKARLRLAGKDRLADRVEPVAITRGDRAGYDIHSYDVDGGPRLIEVKTTRFSSMTPFFASRNEVTFSEENHTEYHLYRLYRFEKDTGLFILSGSLSDTCSLDPVNYMASIGGR